LYPQGAAPTLKGQLLPSKGYKLRFLSRLVFLSPLTCPDTCERRDSWVMCLAPPASGALKCESSMVDKMWVFVQFAFRE